MDPILGKRNITVVVETHWSTAARFMVRVSPVTDFRIYGPTRPGLRPPRPLLPISKIPSYRESPQRPHLVHRDPQHRLREQVSYLVASIRASACM